MQTVEKSGYKLTLEGTWCEITNKYGVLEYGDVAVDEKDIPEGYAEKRLKRFIAQHRVKDIGGITGVIKRVAFDCAIGEYIQLQAVKPNWTDNFVIQKFDNELLFMGEETTGTEDPNELLGWMREHYYIQSGLTATVYRNLEDCTNGGISSLWNNLYLISDGKGPFEASDIRQCVCIERKNVFGEEYVCCKPAVFRKRWYMSGGNFLYSPDSRFREITGISYPIAIHDRYEGAKKWRD